jgi:hypothetical protein
MTWTELRKVLTESKRLAIEDYKSLKIAGKKREAEYWSGWADACDAMLGWLPDCALSPEQESKLCDLATIVGANVRGAGG